METTIKTTQVKKEKPLTLTESQQEGLMVLHLKLKSLIDELGNAKYPNNFRHFLKDRVFDISGKNLDSVKYVVRVIIDESKGIPVKKEFSVIVPFVYKDKSINKQYATKQILKHL